MNKKEFFDSEPVQGFMQWIQKKLDKPGSFPHSFYMKKPALNWSCDSIYSAYENYNWPFGAYDPVNGNKIYGNTFVESAGFLTKLSEGLKQSIETGDSESCKNHCFSILQWGGVLPKNDKKILGIGDNICSYLQNVKDILYPDVCRTGSNCGSLIMNSGFTKIYSLLIDGFIIYDGRVGAALGTLVRRYCENNQLASVPNELTFAWGKGKESTYTSSLENKRNPSQGKYIFPELQNNPKRHIENNIRANWLLKEILERTDSKFNKLDKTYRLRALEAALFMIGYDVTAQK